MRTVGMGIHPLKKIRRQLKYSGDAEMVVLIRL